MGLVKTAVPTVTNTQSVPTQCVNKPYRWLIAQLLSELPAVLLCFGFVQLLLLLQVQLALPRGVHDPTCAAPSVCQLWRMPAQIPP